jgi:hypothetical protein
MPDRPTPQYSETIEFPSGQTRRTLFGLGRSAKDKVQVKVCFHQDVGWWLDCPDGLSEETVLERHPDLVHEARITISEDIRRRSEITATYLRRKQTPLPAAQSAGSPTATPAKIGSDSFVRHDRRTTTEKLAQLRAKQTPDSERIDKPGTPAALAKPVNLPSHDEPVDIFADSDPDSGAPEAGSGTRPGTSPFRHDKEEITARIKAIRDRHRSPRPEPGDQSAIVRKPDNP